jgi:hypothetical protein
VPNLFFLRFGNPRQTLALCPSDPSPRTHACPPPTHPLRGAPRRSYVGQVVNLRPIVNRPGERSSPCAGDGPAHRPSPPIHHARRAQPYPPATRRVQTPSAFRPSRSRSICIRRTVSPGPPLRLLGVPPAGAQHVSRETAPVPVEPVSRETCGKHPHVPPQTSPPARHQPNRQPIWLPIVILSPSIRVPRPRIWLRIVIFALCTTPIQPAHPQIRHRPVTLPASPRNISTRPQKFSPPPSVRQPCHAIIAA